MNSAGLGFKPSRKVSITPPGRSRKPNLPFNSKSGHLTIGPNRPTGKDSRYYAACDCGHRGWYTEAELLDMVDGFSGCGRPSCSAMSYHDKLWVSPDSLKIQHFTITLLRPELMQSWWGGTMDDFYEISQQEGFDNLMGYLEASGISGVWLGRLDENLPFMEGNVRLGKQPDKILRFFAKAKVEVEGSLFTMKELCNISGAKAEDLLLKIYEIGGTDDLLFKLMEEQ